MTEEPLTFHYAPEIEQALVAVCFQSPERIAILKRELDPRIHITRPELRLVLEAIELCYRELGQSDFASVIQVLRELRRLEDCGGLAGVNAILSEYRYGFSSPQALEEIFTHYIEMLQAYARARAQNPPQQVCHFTGGKGTTVPNKVKRCQSDPDEVGEALVAGKAYSLRLWRTQAFTNLRLAPKNP